ncbi:hypothetical protein [Candidatus Phycosocius spiralis]|uniref:Uncharacterized protein n=1 Tax=Candidatus Phycosocius spiralis TaxID=2815099 RepID=A0ABQ4PST4_9PROT|nr:hypothetical protein [Candidatus Phycosocius spiralis]GIU66064.1 hypothetical protein PsB1_0218 [Candidatus Phycosocius spiralis]
MTDLTRIILRLARNPQVGFPSGDARHGYSLVAPLRSDGHLDVAAWQAHRAKCTVRRFDPSPDHGGPEIADGLLTHHGTRWYFHYDEAFEGPDENVDHLGEHRLLIGDYVTITRRGQALTYQVVEETDMT